MQSELISKFSNIYIMLLYSIMTNDMNRVKHYLSDDLYIKYLNIVKENEMNNETQMYGELNVAKIDILKKETIDNKEIITVSLISKYMDYKINKSTGEYKSGNNKFRVEKENILVFEKILKGKEKESIFRCENCGSGLDINATGKCPYCNEIVDLTKYDYILVNLKEENL